MFRGSGFGGNARLLGLPPLTRDSFFLLLAPDSRHALTQFRHELAGQGTPDQATQVGERTGVYGICLDAGGKLVEQGLGMRRAALNQDKRRLPFFGEQGFRENQITTTLRVSLARDDLRCEWW